MSMLNEISELPMIYSKNNPFYAEVLQKINLNGPGSNKETYHLALSLENSNITYEPGDCLGIIPENDEQLVDLLIQTLNLNEMELVTVNEETIPLKRALQTKLEITFLSKSLMRKMLHFTENKSFKQLMENEVALKEYIVGRDLVDVVSEFGPFTWNSAQFTELLRKMPVRLYSIASSNRAHKDEVHLTIGKVSFEKNNRIRIGVCSGQIANRTQIGYKLPVYKQKAPNFKLPKDDNTPIIMIGAGTGIAPYRSFIEERIEREAKGMSWLFFGEQHKATDFLYQKDWERWLTNGQLTKMDVAFSRDQEEKVYVQHRMEEHAKELYEWIQQGAIIYVCGDKNYMAKDVDAMLHKIIETQGNKSKEEAIEIIGALKKQKRYQRDVY